MTAAPPHPDVEAVAARLAPRPAEEVVAWTAGTCTRADLAAGEGRPQRKW